MGSFCRKTEYRRYTGGNLHRILTTPTPSRATAAGILPDSSGRGCARPSGRSCPRSCRACLWVFAPEDQSGGESPKWRPPQDQRRHTVLIFGQNCYWVNTSSFGYTRFQPANLTRCRRCRTAPRAAAVGSARGDQLDPLPRSDPDRHGIRAGMGQKAGESRGKSRVECKVDFTKCDIDVPK